MPGTYWPGIVFFMALTDQIKTFIKDKKLLLPGDSVVVAVSGGVDSVVLLDVLSSLSKEFDLTLIVAHLNHLIRAEASDSDARFVSDLAGAFGLKYCERKLNIKELAKKDKQNLQEYARDARLRFFLEVAKQTGASRIATGHNFDDQAETILMRLIRGVGIRGLVGITPSKAVSEGIILIRPLLITNRSQILKYAKEKRLNWVEDKTNQQNEYFRNRVRNQLLPFIREHLNPEIDSDLVKLSHLCWEEDAKRIKTIGDLREKFTRPGFDSISLDRRGLIGLKRSTAYELLRSSIEDLQGSLRQLEYKHIEMLYEFFCMPFKLGYTRELHLPGLLVAKRRKDKCNLTLAPSIAEKRKAKTPRHTS